MMPGGGGKPFGPGPLGIGMPPGPTRPMAPREIEQGGDAPPGLTESQDPQVACASCEHYQPVDADGGSCGLFAGYPVETMNVCEVFEPGEGSTDMADPDQLGG